MLTIEDVEQFHRAFGHPVKAESEYLNHFETWPSTHDGSLEAHRLVDLRMSLIKEEVTELHDARLANDPTLFADALFDLLYVTYGAIIALGVPRAIGDIVHKSNMSKGIICSQCDGESVGDTIQAMSKYYDKVPCPICKNTGIVPVLREDGKILKGPNWIDDKPLIEKLIIEVCTKTA